jgi:hypothetical protein
LYERALGREPGRVRRSEFVEALENATEEARREVMARAEGAWYEDLLTGEDLESDEPVEDLSE